MKKLSIIIDWTINRSFDHGLLADTEAVSADYLDRIHTTALKHLEALLKAEYERGRMDAIENHTLDGKPL